MLQYWQCSAIFKKYLQCVLVARILIVDFVVCTLAVKKKNHRFRHVGSDHSLVREIGWDGVDWIDMAQDRDQWRVLVNTVMNLRVP
jgi:hypothetical protein